MKTNSSIDSEVIKALKEGDHKSFEEVFLSYYNKTKAFIYGYVKSDADAEERMPSQRKKIYRLSRNEGLTNTEIAEQLNTTKRTVESQLSLALKEIRKVISIFFSTLL